MNSIFCVLRITHIAHRHDHPIGKMTLRKKVSFLSTKSVWLLPSQPFSMRKSSKQFNFTLAYFPSTRHSMYIRNAHLVSEKKEKGLCRLLHTKYWAHKGTKEISRDFQAVKMSKNIQKNFMMKIRPHFSILPWELLFLLCAAVLELNGMLFGGGRKSW